jgi:hypothetical protein
LTVKGGSLLQLAGLVQAHGFGEHASTIETRQSSASSGRPLRTPSALQHGGCAMLTNLVAVEALWGSDRLAYIDFV